MKRLALLLFCTSALASEPMACRDGVCTVEQSKLQAMYESREQMKRERDEAVDAIETTIARAKAYVAYGCGHST